MIRINGKRKETATIAPPENAMMPQGEPKYLGGGYYELPNGEKVQGKKAALKRMGKMRGDAG